MAVFNFFKNPLESEEFKPRELPKLGKNVLEKKVRGGRSLIILIFSSTLLVTAGFWFWANLNTVPEAQSEEAIKVEPTAKVSKQITKIERKNFENIKNEFIVLTRDLKGTWGFYVYNLSGKWEYGLAQDEVFTAASLIKLPVFLALYQEVERGKISLETKYSLKEKDKVSGAGSLYYQPAGKTYTYKQLAELMGKQSDNTAFNIFQKILSGEKIQATIDNLEMSSTLFSENETSPKDIGLFFRKLYGSSLVTREHRDEILSYLTKTIFEDRIPAGVPSEIKVAHKVGTETGVFSDAGIVFAEKPYIIVIMSRGANEVEAKEVLPKVSRLVWEFENRL